MVDNYQPQLVSLPDFERTINSISLDLVTLPKIMDLGNPIWPNYGITNPKNPCDVMGCQVATCFKAPGVSLGGSGVS